MSESDLTASRRDFLATLTAAGLGAALLPGTLSAQAGNSGGVATIDVAMIKSAATLAGLTFTDAQCTALLKPIQQAVERIGALHALTIPNDVSPPFHFSPLVPGMKVDRERRPMRFAKTPKLVRPADLEALAYWPLTHLAQLLRTRAVTSTELTRMYLARLHRYNEKLNCVVTFLDELALSQAAAADAQIAAGKYRGLLHGIPWGCKDIIAVRGYKTTWGSGAYVDQVLDEDASVVAILRDAGAVLLAKLTTGELATGDQWFGGRTNNPWKLDEGSSGSSAGPSSSVVAGLVPFAIGTETSGSILTPSARCGATGLRPTFGRVSRYGVMTLSWTQDRLGPICRHVEDCAVVLDTIARPDGRDLSVTELAFNWNASLDTQRLRVGYIERAFADTDRQPEWRDNEHATLATLRAMGHTLVPLALPDFPIDVLNLNVEAGVFFEELIRTGRDQKLTVAGRSDRMRATRLIPGVDYLQSQRARSMMMQALASATEAVDVYLAPSVNGNARLPEGTPAPRSGSGVIPAEAGTPAVAPPPNASTIHFQMANLASYPAIALPNGFASNGTPTSINFLARPYGEEALIALAKSYQDATGFHLRHPTL
jgi:Asp-tRNA(Asn)/Glu-tRNA(Gln) amidotransferase A subunit family amidase